MKHFIKIAVILCIAAMLWIRYYPIKPAIDERRISTDKDYVICSAAYTTGFEWAAEQSSSSYKGYVFIEGVMEYPQSDIQYDVLPFNKFIFYGRFDGERDFHGKVCPVFRAESWDVIAPVKRETIIPNFLCPSYGLTWVDFYH